MARGVGAAVTRKDWVMLALVVAAVFGCYLLLAGVMDDCRRRGGTPVRGVFLPIECVPR